MTGSAPGRPAVRLGPVPPDVAEAVTAVLASIQWGFNAKAPGTSSGGFAADAVVVSPDGRRTAGSGDLASYQQLRLSGPASLWRMQQHVDALTLVDPDTVIADLHQEMETPDGSFTNRGTAVLVRRAGAWWIARFHNTRVLGEA